MPDPPSLILASASPRRRRLLELIGLRHRVAPADIEESPHPDESPESFAIRAAVDKASLVAARQPGTPVLGADTVVALDGEALGKPRSEEEAAAMLRRLSGRSHLVHTAVALSLDGRCEPLLDTALVRFAALDHRVIRWYVATGEPMDKAGAYAVQGAGGLLVSAVEGSPQTVIGLPVHRLPELFAKLGIDFWKYIEERG